VSKAFPRTISELVEANDVKNEHRYLVFLIWVLAIGPALGQTVFQEESRGVRFTIPAGFKPKGDFKPYKAQWRDEGKEWKLRFTAFEISKSWEQAVAQRGGRKGEPIRIEGAKKAIIFRGPTLSQGYTIVLARNEKYHFEWHFYGKHFPPPTNSNVTRPDIRAVEKAMRGIASSARITN
jgi:hypothetical protein